MLGPPRRWPLLHRRRCTARRRGTRRGVVGAATAAGARRTGRGRRTRYGTPAARWRTWSPGAVGCGAVLRGRRSCLSFDHAIVGGGPPGRPSPHIGVRGDELSTSGLRPTAWGSTFGSGRHEGESFRSWPTPDCVERHTRIQARIGGRVRGARARRPGETWVPRWAAPAAGSRRPTGSPRVARMAWRRRPLNPGVDSAAPCRCGRPPRRRRRREPRGSG